jgi:hypothetical protein
VRFHEEYRIDTEGKDAEGVLARARGNHLRRNRSEISLETERNTNTASAPIMPKAIIIFSVAPNVTLGTGKPHASRGMKYLQHLQYASRWQEAGVQIYGQKCGLKLTLRQDFRPAAVAVRGNMCGAKAKARRYSFSM